MLRDLESQSLPILSGIVEVDETFFRHSRSGQLNHDIAEGWLNKLLSEEPPTLCSDGKEWMIRFHGVATKYLSNYMA